MLRELFLTHSFSPARNDDTVSTLILIYGRNLPKLTALWVGALQEYAKLRLDSDMFAPGIGEGTAARGSRIDTYLEATKDVTLPVRCFLLIPDSCGY